MSNGFTIDTKSQRSDINSSDVPREKVTVLWDISACSIPEGFSVEEIVSRIHLFFNRESFKGPIEISALCCLGELSSSLREQLIGSSLSIHDVPAGNSC